MARSARSWRASRIEKVSGASAFSVFAILLAVMISLFMGMISFMADLGPNSHPFDVSVLLVWAIYAFGGFVLGLAFPKAWGLSALVPTFAMIQALPWLLSGCSQLSHEHCWWITFNYSFGSAFVAVLAGYLAFKAVSRRRNVDSAS